jgi:hypothetical protein
LASSKLVPSKEHSQQLSKSDELVLRSGHSNKKPGFNRLCENWGESGREGRIDNDAVFSMSYIRGEDREQASFLPARIDDYVGTEAAVRVIDAFAEGLTWSAWVSCVRFLRLRVDPVMTRAIFLSSASMDAAVHESVCVREWTN